MGMSSASAKTFRNSCCGKSLTFLVGLIKSGTFWLVARNYVCRADEDTTVSVPVAMGNSQRPRISQERV